MAAHRWFLVAYLPAIAAAAALEAASFGVAAAAVQVGIALVLCVLGATAISRRLVVLMAPLIGVAVTRAVTLTLVQPRQDSLGRAAAVGGLVALTVALTARAASGDSVHESVDGPVATARWVQVLVTLCGVPIGLAAYAAQRDTITSPRGDAVGVVLDVVVLVLFAAAAEEILFRGLLTPRTRLVFGRGSVLVDGFVYATIYAGSQSLALVGLAMLIGVAAARVRLRTGRLSGLIGAHSIANVVCFVIVPWLVAR